MIKFKEHIATKTATLLLACLLLVPTTVSFSHIFTHHKHDICYGKKTTHLHEINKDCDFYKFKISTCYTAIAFNFDLFFPTKIFQAIESQPKNVFNFKRFDTSLRAPPILV